MGGSAAEDGQGVTTAGRLGRLDDGAVWQADEGTHLALLMQEIREPNALEYIVDLLLQQLPDRANAARMGCRATLLFDGVRDAVQIEGRRLRGSDHGADRSRLGTASELIAATRAASAAHDFRPPKSQQNLFDVIDGKPLPRSDLAASDRPFRGSSREVERADHAVLGQGGNAHSLTLRPASG